MSVGLKIRFLQAQLSRKSFIASVMLICFIDYFIGGGNYITALFSIQANFLFLCLMIYRSHKNAGGLERLKQCAPYMLFCVVAFAGLMISALAPGNAVRQEMFGTGTVTGSIYGSIVLAFEDISNWTSPVLLVLLVCSAPFAWGKVKTSAFAFPYPLLASCVSFLLFASLNTPTLYAMGSAGEPRLRNIVFFFYIWLVFGNAYYWLGWFHKRFELQPRVDKKSIRSMLLVCIPVFTIVFLHGIGSSNMMASFRDLRAGLPQQFLAEYNDRLALLLDETRPSVEIAPYSAFPATLLPFHDDGGYAPLELVHTPVSGSWYNRLVAAYYGKESVVGYPSARVRAYGRMVRITDGGRAAYVESYFIHESNYFRLGDIAYILQDVFDAFFVDGQRPAGPSRADANVGGEAGMHSDGFWWEPAILNGTDLAYNGVNGYAISYNIRGEIYYRLADIANITGLWVEWSDGAIVFSVAD